jgi:hypothetical protein
MRQGAIATDRGRLVYGEIQGGQYRILWDSPFIKTSGHLEFEDVNGDGLPEILVWAERRGANQAYPELTIFDLKGNELTRGKCGPRCDESETYSILGDDISLSDNPTGPKIIRVSGWSCDISGPTHEFALVNGFYVSDTRHKPRGPKVDALAANWTDCDLINYDSLYTAAFSFFQAHGAKEVDPSRDFIAVTSAQFNELVSALERFEHGELPHFSEDDLTQADAELNLAYQKIQKNPKFHYPGATQGGIKETQRAWIAYRDALVRFEQGRLPGVSQESWKAWLTRQRLETLKQFVPYSR